MKLSASKAKSVAAAFPPNDEQKDIIDAVKTGDDVKAIAGAGTGKTSTMKMVAEAMPGKTILYLAFNKKAQLDAEARMPRNVTCKTSHGLAYGPVGRTYAARLNSGRVPSWKLAKTMGYRTLDVGGERIVAAKVAMMVRRTVDRYCHSADRTIEANHVPWVSAWTDEQNYQLRKAITPMAVRAWADVMESHGDFPFTFDSYLKIYQLGEPNLGSYDIIVLDEAQDTNPCVSDIVMRQKGRCQLIMVGDPCQAIYEWRGATNAMEGFDTEHTLPLSQSYRFGPAIAEEANRWLEMLDSPLRLRGFDEISSVVQTESLSRPSAVLCRGNSGVIAEAMTGLSEGKRVAVVGGGGPLALLARAAANLMAGATTDHPDLIAFQDWQEVRKYVKEEREDAGNLAPLVQIIDTMGPEAILRMCDQLTHEDKKPDLVVGTAHKAKGAEWPTVQVAGDFTPPKPDSEPRPDELRLAYVTVTRAQHTLGLGSLAWPRERGGEGRTTARAGLGLDPYAGEEEPSLAERMGITDEEMREVGI